MKDPAVEQWDRVRRWLHKFDLLMASGPPKTEDDDQDNKDVIYAFFQSCRHLRDWLVESGTLPASLVDPFVESNSDLRICKAICDGSKHYRLTRPHIDLNSHRTLHSSVISAGIIGSGFIPLPRLCYFVTVNNNPLDTHIIAHSCVMNWEVFLEKHGIINKDTQKE